jgi:hypothetical protein
MYIYSVLFWNQKLREIPMVLLSLLWQHEATVLRKNGH